MIYNTSKNIFLHVLNLNDDVTWRKNGINIFEQPPSWMS